MGIAPIILPPPETNTRKPRSHFERLSNKDLIASVIANSKNKKYALELEQRWIEFWILAKNKTNQHPDDLHDELLALRENIQKAGRDYLKIWNRLQAVKVKVSEQEAELRSLQKSDWNKLKRFSKKQQTEITRLRNHCLLWEKEVRERNETITTMLIEKTALLNQKDRVMDAQRKLTEENLGRVERDLRRLVLYEAGVLTK